MSRRREPWVYGCLCVVFVLGFLFGIIFPIFGVFFVIIAILGIAIIYVYRTQDFDASNDTPTFTDEEAQESETIQHLVQEALLGPVPAIEIDNPETQVSASPSEPSHDESSESTKELQKRIAELEKRVLSLNEQLARDSLIIGNDSKLLREDSKEIVDEQLSETAIQHLLEALEEKLAKRAISKQLYTQLRDKYIARMEKAKKRRKTLA